MKKMLKILLSITVAGFLTMPLYGNDKSNIPVDEIRDFVDVYNAIRHDYVDKKDGKTLIDYAIKGMVNGLDPHSAYYDKSASAAANRDVKGSYWGFGFQLEIRSGRLLIVSPIADSPADKAGLQPGDHIIKVDDTVIKNMSMNDVAELFAKKKKVTLTIIRKAEKPQQIKLAKATVDVPSIKSKILDKHYGYIRIRQFQTGTADQFDRALTTLIDQDDIKGLVIDMRNNPGGLVRAATAIADKFLPGGLIVSIKNKNTGSEDKIHANKATLAPKLPLVVMINEGSASASELLSGALQDHHRAIIVGNKSFGKASVQTVLNLSKGNAVKLTTGRYYTPNGHSIQALGITPDIILARLSVKNDHPDLLSYSEANIPKHLAPSVESRADEKSADKVAKDSNLALAKSDLQLAEALYVLKTVYIGQQQRQ